MPFKSEAQRKFLYAHHKALAEEFSSHTPKDADLPEHVAKKKKRRHGLGGTVMDHGAGDMD